MIGESANQVRWCLEYHIVVLENQIELCRGGGAGVNGARTFVESLTEQQQELNFVNV